MLSLMRDKPKQEQESNRNNIRDKSTRMYATEGNTCPVKMFKTFLQKRPPRMCNPDDPFYLSVVTNNINPSEDEQWFLSLPMGKYKMCKIMKNMVEAAGLNPEKRLTNTCARKYLCQKITRQ